MDRHDAREILGRLIAANAGQGRTGHGGNVGHGSYLFHLVEFVEFIDGLLR